MKLLQNRTLISNGEFPQTNELVQIYSEITDSIRRVVWPQSSNLFSINPVKKGNGVKPIKNNCMKHLNKSGWMLEHRMALGSRISPGPIDAVKKLQDGRYFAVEWETGNISSSHRAMNKMAMGVIENILAGGVLILPSRSLYKYLTDRIGNFAEIEPYFSIWERLGKYDPNIFDAYIAVIEVEYDELSEDISLIPKGTDGRALV
jgi:hypothetical protein